MISYYCVLPESAWKFDLFLQRTLIYTFWAAEILLKWGSFEINLQFFFVTKRFLHLEIIRWFVVYRWKQRWIDFRAVVKFVINFSKIQQFFVLRRSFISWFGKAWSFNQLWDPKLLLPSIIFQHWNAILSGFALNFSLLLSKCSSLIGSWD